MNAPEILPEPRPYDPKNFTFYVTPTAAETFEEFVARDWAERAKKERKPNIGHNGKHAEGSSEAGRKSAEARGLTQITASRKAAIKAILAKGAATVADIRSKLPSLNESAVRHVIGIMEAEGSVVRHQLKRVSVFALSGDEVSS